MEGALELAFADFAHRPPPQHAGLNASFDAKSADSDAQRVIEEVESIAPTVQGLTPSRVLALKEAFEYLKRGD